MNVVTNNKTAVCCYCFLIRCYNTSDQSEPDTFLELESACTLHSGILFPLLMSAFFVLQKHANFTSECSTIFAFFDEIFLVVVDFSMNF